MERFVKLMIPDCVYLFLIVLGALAFGIGVWVVDKLEERREADGVMR